jgi:beta-lactamase class A
MDDIINALKKNKKDKETDNRITAKRYSIFFRSLYNATYLDQEYSQLFMKILEQAPDDYAAVGLPPDIPFVHKTGIRIDERVMADSGIVYVPGRPYILTIMVQQKKKGELDQEEAKKLLQKISEEVYSYVSKPF